MLIEALINISFDFLTGSSSDRDQRRLQTEQPRPN